MNVTPATDHEDADHVTIAFLVATAALQRGRPVAMFHDQGSPPAWRPDYAQAIEIRWRPSVSRLFDQFRDQGGELLLCPIRFQARGLDEDAIIDGARLAGATPLWDWIGDENAAVFSY